MSGSLTNRSDVGVLLVGHGTRDSLGLAEFAKVVHEVENQIRPVPVQSAFLELATPTISGGIKQLIERDVRHIVVSPLLLFAAGHAKQDIPAAMEAALQRHPGIEWRQADPLGCHPALLELSARRFAAAIAERPVDIRHRIPSPGDLRSAKWLGRRPATARGPATARRSRLILVGRGSHDLEAIQETTRYVKLLAERVGIDEPQVAFLAMAEPRLGQLLADAAESKCDVVIVQPHLLFYGELLEDLQRQVGDWSTREPDKQWILTEHLGAEPEVVAAVIERYQTAAAAWNGT